MTRPFPLPALLALLLTAACGTVKVDPESIAPRAPAAETPTPFSRKIPGWRLVLVHMSDTEAGLLPDDSAASGGIARMQAVTAALKNRAGTDAIVLAAGDMFIPSPELSLELDGKSAVLQGNTQLFVQASALGNHELDLGEQFLADAIAQMPFPYLSATLHVKGGPLQKVAVELPPGAVTPWAQDAPGKLLPRAKVCASTMSPGPDGALRCNGLIVGIVGATTEELRLIASGATSDLQMPNDLAGVRDDVQAQVEALRAEGISVVVLLSHLQGAAREAELVRLGLVGVDVVVAGGGENRLASSRHRLADGDAPDRLCSPRTFGQPCYPTTLVAADGKPVLLVATGGDMRYVGNLITNFDEDGVLTGYNDAASRAYPVDEETLLELRSIVDKGTLAWQQRVHTELQPLLQVVATTSVYLEGSREQVRNRETNFGDLSADAIANAGAAAGGLFALRNGGGIRGPIGRIDPQTGARTGAPIRLLDLKTALRFDTPLVVVESTHAGLRATLESALRGAGTSKGHFPQVSREVHLEYTTRAPEQTHTLEGGRIASLACVGARVRSLVITPAGGAAIVVVRDGKVLTPDAPIRFTTLEYLAKGGDGWFPAQSVRYTAIEGATEQSALTRYIGDEDKAGRWNGGKVYFDGKGDRILKLDGPVTDLPTGCSP